MEIPIASAAAIRKMALKSKSHYSTHAVESSERQRTAHVPPLHCERDKRERDTDEREYAVSLLLRYGRITSITSATHAHQ